MARLLFVEASRVLNEYIFFNIYARHDAFMACFQHVSHELQNIYRDLTKSSKHPLGGNAYLSLDDTEVCMEA